MADQYTELASKMRQSLGPDNDPDRPLTALVTSIRWERDELRARAEKAEAERDAAVRALKEIAEMDYTRAATNMMGYNAVKLARSTLNGGNTNPTHGED